jgi:hypothetical protein
LRLRRAAWENASARLRALLTFFTTSDVSINGVGVGILDDFPAM